MKNKYLEATKGTSLGHEFQTLDLLLPLRYKKDSLFGGGVMANISQKITTASSLGRYQNMQRADSLTVTQTDFSRTLAICNSGKLVHAMVDAFEALYEKYPAVTDHLPDQVMYRCFMISQLLLTFELYAVVYPEELTIDPFEVL